MIARRAGTGAVRWHGDAEETEPPVIADLPVIPLAGGAAIIFRASSAPRAGR